ncbi:alpha-L-fucosidase-like isoform X2 [Watersipora subatra]
MWIALAGTLMVIYNTLAPITGQYTPTWDSLDSRPLPTWYDESKIGIFVHWGVFSVPALHGSNFWKFWHDSKPGDFYYEFMKKNYREDWTYADFASQFTAELFDPKQWADLFEDAGAKYVVLITKHHEGFCNWNTNYSFNWNAMQVGPKRDLVAEVSKAVRGAGLHLGLYHSLYEWFNPLYLLDKGSGYRSQLFVKGKTIPELYELVNTYRPDLIWSDGNNEASDDYFDSKEFLTWLYNDSPVKDQVVVNDRWGNTTNCKHGGYLTCDDRYNPKVLQARKWENCDSVQKTAWGYRRDDDLRDYKPIHDIISTMAQTISCGGNYLLNVGPTHDGRILPIFEERLRQMGAWLKVNGEAIYASSPWRYQNDTVSGNVWYTKKKSNSSITGYSIYAFVLDWPLNNKLTLGAPIATPAIEITMLGYSQNGKNLQYDLRKNDLGIMVYFPYIPPNELPSFYAWVLKLDNVANV